MSIAERLRQALDALGLKITEASEKSGIPYRSWQNYLRGERDPGAEALQAMSTRLGISIDWLLTGQGEMLRGAAPGLVTRTSREEGLLTLFRELPEAEQREIQHVAEEKKRLLEVERRLEEVATALADSKRAS